MFYSLFRSADLAQGDPSVEDIAANFDEICDMDVCKPRQHLDHFSRLFHVFHRLYDSAHASCDAFFWEFFFAQPDDLACRVLNVPMVLAI